MINKIKLTMGSTLVLAGAAIVAAPANADPTCSALGIAVHAEHIIGDYVTGIGGLSGNLGWPPKGQVGEAVKENGGAKTPGGPGPAFHFTADVGAPPGASFCVAQAQSQKAVENNNAVKDDLP